MGPVQNGWRNCALPGFREEQNPSFMVNAVFTSRTVQGRTNLDTFVNWIFFVHICYVYNKCWLVVLYFVLLSFSKAFTNYSLWMKLPPPGTNRRRLKPQNSNLNPVSPIIMQQHHQFLKISISWESINPRKRIGSLSWVGRYWMRQRQDNVRCKQKNWSKQASNYVKKVKS